MNTSPPLPTTVNVANTEQQHLGVTDQLLVHTQNTCCDEVHLTDTYVTKHNPHGDAVAETKATKNLWENGELYSIASLANTPLGIPTSHKYCWPQDGDRARGRTSPSDQVALMVGPSRGGSRAKQRARCP